MSSWGSVGLLLLVTGLVALLIYSALVLRRYIRIILNILQDQASNSDNGNDFPRLDGEEVTFRGVDGHRLEGVIRTHRSDEPALGMVVFAHEYGSDRSSCLRYCRALLDAGYDVFAFDFRNHGTSPPETGYRPRQWPSDRERADMLGAIAFISSYLEQQDRPADIGVFGISRGGGAAILASVGIDEVKAIVTDGAFSSDTTLEYLMRRFATTFARIRIVAENHPPMFWRFFRWLLFRELARRSKCRFPSVRKAIVRLGSKPILLIHGEKDSYIPIAQSQDLYDLARGPKYLWIVPEAKHNQSVLIQPAAYAQRIVRFFDEHLAAHRPARTPALRLRHEKAPASSPSPASSLVGAGLEEAVGRG
jgi:pimeloyl-ACP methyl ester carboxylesterase